MDRVTVNTSQNVFIDYEAAGVGDRSIAAILDLFLLFAYLLSVSILIEPESPAVFVIIFLPYFLYFLIAEIFFNGQTLGKKMRGIKVSRIDGTEPRLGDYIIRWLLRLIEVDLTFGMVALVTLFARGKGQRLGDMAAGTAVVKTRPPVSLNDTLYTALESEYQPVFKEVNLLSPKDIALTKEVVESLQASRFSAKMTEVAHKMKATLEQKMSISSDLSALNFLETVIKDYNHIKR